MRRISKIDKTVRTENNLKQNNKNAKKDQKKLQEFNNILKEEHKKLKEKQDRQEEQNKQEQEERQNKKAKPLDIYKIEIQKSKSKINQITEKLEEKEQEER